LELYIHASSRLVARRVVSPESQRLRSLRPVSGTWKVCAPDSDAVRQGVNA
jgi:hypothetical protein